MATSQQADALFQRVILSEASSDAESKNPWLYGGECGSFDSPFGVAQDDRKMEKADSSGYPFTWMDDNLFMEQATP